MPDVTADVRSQLLLHQLLVGLPTAVSKQLRANGDVNDFISRNWRSKGLRGIRSLRNSMSIENVWTHSENCS